MLYVATNYLTVEELPSVAPSIVVPNASLTGTFTVGRLQNNDSSGIVTRSNANNSYCGNSSWGGTITTFTINASHTHTLTANKLGSDQPHNNMQPFVTCYMWKRVA